MAVQMLYQSDLGGASEAEIVQSFRPVEALAGEGDGGGEGERAGALTAEAVTAALDYARRLFRGTLQHRQEIDDLIRAQAEHWRLERMPVVDRNVLRLAVYELLYEQDVPRLVVVDEAIELAKRFGSEQSGSFVNGLLDGLLRSEVLAGRAT